MLPAPLLRTVDDEQAQRPEDSYCFMSGPKDIPGTVRST